MTESPTDIRESRRRSLAKTITWRGLATLTTTLIVLAFTGQIDLAATVGGVESVAKIFLYYVHERLVNVVDVPALCNFIFPAVYYRDPLQISVSTSGASPALASWFRDRIANDLEDHPIEDLIEYIGDWRTRVRGAIETFAGRRAFWRGAFGAGVPSLFLAGDRQRAEAELLGLLETLTRAP